MYIYNICELLRPNPPALALIYDDLSSCGQDLVLRDSMYSKCKFQNLPFNTLSSTIGFTWDQFNGIDQFGCEHQAHKLFLSELRQYGHLVHT